MDTFYEENQENNIRVMKNKMTLDFNSPTSHNKKAKLIKTCILESPDLKMLKLASPELERMIIAQNGMVTTTPTPSSILPYFLKQETEVTEEQEQYARGFVDALNHLHQTNGYQERPQLQPQQPPQPQQQQQNCLNSSQLTNTNTITNSNNNHNNSHNSCNNNNNSNNQTNGHQMVSHSSDSSSDLTIADNTSNSCNNINNRRNNNNYLNSINTSSNNSYSGLMPPTTGVGVPSSTASFNGNKFAVPNIPPQEQYVNTCLAQSNGADVIINNNSVLPPYSQAVSNNSIYPMTIKVEPQQKQIANQSVPTTTSCRGLSPPLSPPQQSSLAPIDMADQERIKLERKRLRNRIAASKCRRRKLERISRLEDKVKGLKGENSELSVVVNKLRDQVCSLKQQVMDHVKCGCQLMAIQ